MNTKELLVALIEAIKEHKHERAKALLPLIANQLQEEYDEGDFGPIVPEDVFLLLNDPDLRGFALCAFLALTSEL